MVRPSDFKLYANRPNPFNPETIIVYDLPNASHVVHGIYNLMGQEIARLVDGRKETGQHSIHWDGKDSQGRLVPSGVYICHFQVAGFSESRKLILSR